MARNRDEEEVSLVRIGGEEPALPNVLEEVTFARVFPGELPRRVEIRLRITVRVHKHLQLPLHLLVVHLKRLRRVEHSRRVQLHSARCFRIDLSFTYTGKKKQENQNQNEQELEREKVREK